MRKLITVIAALLLAFSFSQTGVKKANAATTAPTEVEPNNSPATANALTFVQDPQNSALATASIQGTVQDSNDMDYYKFTLSNPGKVTIKMNPTPDSNIGVILFDSAGNPLDIFPMDFFNTSTNSSSNLFSEGLGKGTYYVLVMSQLYGQSSTAAIPYNLEVDYTQSNNYEQELNDDPTTANPISLNTVYNGFADPDADDYYKFTVTKPGELNIDLSQDAANVFDAELLSSDGSTTIYSASTTKSSSTSLVNKFHTGLRPGTYYLKITGDDANNSYNVPYSFRVDFSANSYFEQEGNNSTSSANTISLNNVYKGVLSTSTDKDFYKITIPKNMTTALYLTRPVNTKYTVKILKANGSVYGTYNSSYGNNALTPFIGLNLPAGTYYIQMNYYQGSGNSNVAYSFKMAQTDFTAPAAPKVNTITDQSTAVTGTAEASSTISVKVNGKIIKTGSADKYGKFSLSISKQKAGTLVSVTAKDFSGNESKATSVKVKDVTPPSAPSVSSVTHTATYVTGRTEAGAKVLINVGSKTIASGTADSKGNFRVKIAAQRAKTSLYVYSVDGSGNKSKATVVAVK